jgi:site-specific recombinase XerD
MTDELHLDVFQAYLLAEDRSPLTIAGYVGDVRLFAQWFEKQFKDQLTPEALTNEAVRGYKQYLLDQANKPKTINRRLAALAAYAHWLEQAGYVKNARNPVQGVKAVKEAVLAPKWLDKKQRAALLRAVDKEIEDAVHRYPRLRMMYLRDAAIVKIILYAGLRVGEIIQLRLSDVILGRTGGPAPTSSRRTPAGTRGVRPATPSRNGAACPCGRCGAGPSIRGSSEDPRPGQRRGAPPTLRAWPASAPPPGRTASPTP